MCVLSRAYLTLHPLGLRQRLGSIYDRVWLEEQQMKASAAAILCAYYYTSKAGEEAVKAVEADWPQTHIYSVYSSLHNIYIYDQKVSCCCIIFFLREIDSKRYPTNIIIHTISSRFSYNAWV